MIDYLFAAYSNVDDYLLVLICEDIFRGNIFPVLLNVKIIIFITIIVIVMPITEEWLEFFFFYKKNYFWLDSLDVFLCWLIFNDASCFLLFFSFFFIVLRILLVLLVVLRVELLMCLQALAWFIVVINWCYSYVNQHTNQLKSMVSSFVELLCIESWSITDSVW